MKIDTYEILLKIIDTQKKIIAIQDTYADSLLLIINASVVVIILLVFILLVMIFFDDIFNFWHKWKNKK